MRAETACPKCGGRLVISDERRLMYGRAVLFLNCGGCGLFQTAEPVEEEVGSETAAALQRYREGKAISLTDHAAQHGIVLAAEMVPCGRCGGKGEWVVRVEGETKWLTRCSECDGSGRVKEGSHGG